ncbi:MAG TPA: autotransporter-associated beta strand repeat-containing protein [Verrucomicrobiae bacterium]
MKTNIQTKSILWGATIIGMILSGGASASADTITNSINQSGSGDWTQAIWGSPPAVAASGNDYLVGGPLGGTFNAVRTINTGSTPQSFAGDHLILTNGGTLFLKNAGAACNVNAVIDGGQIIFHGSAGSGVQLGGTLQVNLNPNTAEGEGGTTGTSFYNLGQDQTGVNTRNILLQANLSGNGNLIVNMGVIASGTLNTVQISGTNTAFAGSWTNNQGTLEIESSSVNPLGSGPVIMTLANNTFLNFNSTNNLVITNSIFGNGAVGQINTGTVTLNGNNTFTGRTTIAAGTLKIGANSSLTNSTIISLTGGATLDVSAIGGLVMNNDNNQIMANCNGNVTGNLMVSPNNALNFNLTSTTNDILNVSGSLTLNGTPALNLMLNGSKPNGTYRLINYSGTIQGGGSFTVVPPAGSSETFTLNTSTPGQINLVVSGAVVHNLIWVGGINANWDLTTANWTGDASVFAPGDNVTFNDTGSAASPIDFVLNVAPGSITVSNTAKQYIIGDDSTSFGIVTSGGLIKYGTNELDFFTPGNNISGLIDIEAGTLSIGIGGLDGSLGTGSITNNGILQVNLDGGAVAFNSPISGSGSLNVIDTGGSAGATVTIGGNGHNSYTGLTTIGNQCQLNIATSNALGSTSSGTFVQSGGRLGVVSTVGAMTVAEPVTINGSGLAVNFGALYVSSPGNNVTWAGPITVDSASTIRALNGGRMNFSSAVLGTNVALLSVAGNPATIGGADTSAMITFLNTLSLGASGSLTVDGVGTVILAGSTNLWGGGTIVNGGTLLVNGTLNGGAVTVTPATTNTPTLGGSGTILGSVTVRSGGVLAPAGNSGISTLTVNNSVVFNSGSTSVMELNRASSPNSDQLVANSISFGGTLTVTNVGEALQNGDTFHLFSGGSGMFAALNLPALSSSLFWDTSLLNSSGIIKVASNTAPTPTITSPSVSGGNFILQVALSQSGFNYVLQTTPALASATWINIYTNAGTGGTLNFTNLITPGNPQQFFRVSVQ